MKTTAPKAALFLPMLVLYFFQSLSAQNQVAGVLRDAGGKPLGFASVLLLAAADSALLRGQISSEHGDFVFENVPAGRYLCSFSMLGFEPGFSQPFLLAETTGRLELEPVVLQESAALLNEALVVAKRPFLEQQVDRTVVNVANSITKAGGTALEVLQRSPGVQVNTLTKSISLLGKEGVVVMINGKISRQPADAILQMLAGMNAGNIDRIELIHTPPANFEAEGNAGIINIVLKSTGDEGLNGGYSVKGGYGKAEKYGAGAYFNSRNKRLNWFGNYDYNFDLNPQVFTNYRRVQQGADVLETDTYSNRPHTPTGTHDARLGVDVQVSPKTVVGVLGSFFDRNWYMEAENNVTYSKNDLVDARLRMPNTETNHNRSFAGNLNLAHQFSARQSLSLDVDFIRYDITNPSHYTVQTLDAGGTPMTQNELRIAKNTPIRVAVGKADYALAIGKSSKLEAGAKGTLMRFDNDVQVESRAPQQDWALDQELSSMVQLDEEVLGAFTTFSSKINSKTDIKAGLRYEYTRTHLGSVEQADLVNRKYGSWFPSLFVTHQLSDKQSLSFSYSRRIGRPKIRQLAPWLIFSDPSTLEGGNPALQPSFTNTVKLDYGFKALRFSLSYSHETNPIRFLPNVDPVANRQINRNENLDRERVIGANMFLPFHPAPWWDMQNNLYVNSTALNFALEGKSLQLSNLNYGCNTTQTFRLPRQFSLEVSGNYSSPGYWGVAKWKANGSLSVGLQKDFGEPWGKVSFNASDLFMSSNWFGTTSQPELDLLVRSSYQFSERTFMLSWTNTFGNKKLKSARQRQTGSAEEMRRI